MNKLFKRHLLLVGVILVLFNIVFLVVPFQIKWSINYWLCFVFTNLAILALIPILNLAFSKSFTIKSKVYGLPIYHIGYILICLSIAFSFSFAIVSTVLVIKSWFIIIVYVLLYGLVGIGLISSSTARDIIEEIDRDTNINTSFITNIQLKLSIITSAIDEKEVKEKWIKLIDNVRYSDPLSNENTKSIELNILQSIEEFEKLIVENNKEILLLKIDNLIDLVKQRNLSCKISK
jgi:hypothetical protein